MENNKNHPYVFISYAHADSNSVLPLIDAMKAKGIRLWFDEGIEAGSEWPEYIAQKVMDCHKFVLFISNAYLQSQNCKRELNFAISRKKEILSVYLEEVRLSPGMEMQLGTYQAVFRNRFGSADAFSSSLCGEQFFKDCTGTGGGFSSGSSASSGKKSNVRNIFHQSSSGGYSHSSSYARGQASAPKSPSGGYSSYQANPSGYQPPNPGYQQPNPGYQQAPGYPPPNPGYQQVAGGYQPPPATTVYANPLPLKSKVVAALLAIFLGCFGIHKFYLCQPGKGILYLLFFWTYIPQIVGFIEGIRILCMSEIKFQTKYQCRLR